jgi:hypothetical protein
MFSTMFFLNKGVVSWLPPSHRQPSQKLRAAAIINSPTKVTVL